MRAVVIWTIVLSVGVPALLLALFRWFERRRLEHDACGRCLYPVAHLPTRVCPECGGDLDIVGVVRHGQRRKWAVVGQVVALAGLIFFAFVVTANFVVPLLPQRVRVAEYTFLEPTAPSETYQFCVVGERVQWQKNRFSAPANEGADRIWLTFGSVPAQRYGASGMRLLVPGTHQIILERGAASFIVIDPQGRRSEQRAFGDDDLEAWLQALPIGLSEVEAVDHAMWLMLFVQTPMPSELRGANILDAAPEEMRSGQSPLPLPLLPRSGNIFTGAVTEAWFRWVGSALLLLLWIWLAYRIVRGRRSSSSAVRA